MQSRYDTGVTLHDLASRITELEKTPITPNPIFDSVHINNNLKTTYATINTILFANSKDELDYLNIIIICSSLIFGLLQFPFTEPFFTGLIIILLTCILYNKNFK